MKRSDKMDLCLVKLLDYEAQQYKKKSRVLECKDCVVKENCAKWVKENEANSKDRNT